MSYGTGQGSNDTLIERAGQFFYLVNWNTHKFEQIKDVPDYVVDAVPFFTASIFIEMLITYIKGYNHPRFFYVVNNITGGIFEQTLKVVHKPVLLVMYCWLYEHCRIYELPWDSAITWYLTFLAVDFLYYWFHRAAHEVNIFWASHQMHHSSEDYNLSTALRQGMVQKYISALFYLPLAICIPPSIFFIHTQFNLLYQFWIHTEVVGKLGPLEYIFNTASHHRVHHGRNPYCIDKNYGGTLIIWDRLFNTFAAEEEKVAYGLIHMQKSSNPWVLQFGHYIDLFKRSYSMDNWSDRLSVLFCGPGWLSESEKAGLTPEEMELPEVECPVIYRDLNYFNMENDRLESIYAFIHFLALDIAYAEFFTRRTTFSSIEVTALMLFFFWTLTSIGFVFENRPYWRVIECVRCLFVLVMDFSLSWHGYTNPVMPNILLNVTRLLYIGSIGLTLYMTKKIPIERRKEE